MKLRVIPSVLTLGVLLLAAFVAYRFGLPELDNSHVGCAYGGGGGKSLGCSTSFGSFIVYVVAGAAIVIGLIWSRPGRH